MNFAAFLPAVVGVTFAMPALSATVLPPLTLPAPEQNAWTGDASSLEETSVPPAVATKSFDITLSYGSGLTESQKTAFTLAETFWESVITGYRTLFYDPADPGFNGPVITAQGVSIDGVNGILGQAGPSTVYFVGSSIYTATGLMSFDTADLSAMEAKGSLTEIIIHEMAHVLGFGTLWGITYQGKAYNTFYSYGTSRYYGTYALDAYRSECDAGASHVPVETDGGSGTAYSHWDESWACGRDELMTGWLDSPTTISLTTIAAFDDLGYYTDLSSWVGSGTVPLPGALPLMLSGCAAVAVLRLRRRRRLA